MSLRLSSAISFFLKLLVLAGFLLISTGSRAQTVTVKNVGAKEFNELLKNGNVVLIDLRTDEEIARKGFIKGAKQIDYFKKDSEKEILALDRNKTYLIYCAGGGRSSECATLMEQNKFTRIYNLEKGFDDWKRQGFEVESSK